MEKPEDNMIKVEVAFALPDRQRIIVLQVPQGTTARQVAERSGIVREFPEIDIATADMGIFSKNLDGKLLPVPDEYQMKEMDRVEIYRPLIADPKEVRKKRAADVKKRKGAEEGVAETDDTSDEDKS